MKRKYTIQAYVNTGLGIVRMVLTESLEWAIATNNACKFSSAEEASRFWRELPNSGPYSIPIQGTMHIRGPRDGYYRITCAPRFY